MTSDKQLFDSVGWPGIPASFATRMVPRWGLLMHIHVMKLRSFLMHSGMLNLIQANVKCT